MPSKVRLTDRTLSDKHFHDDRLRILLIKESVRIDMNSIEILKAHSHQAGEIAQVFRESRLSALPYLPKLHTPEDEFNYFANVVFQEKEVFIATDRKNNKILGFIVVDQLWVEHLYLLPELSRTGIGSRLLSTAKKGKSRLQLWTFQRNLAAQQFYLKHGFKVVKETDGSTNEEKEPDILMEWTAQAD